MTQEGKRLASWTYEDAIMKYNFFGVKGCTAISKH